MRNSSKTHGVFSWNELITTDLESAKEFYGTLLGWTFTETQTIYGHTYLVAHKDDIVVGGMMLKGGNVPAHITPCWDPYISVEDVEISARQVKDLGGKVVLPPTEIPGIGRFCVIMDAQGVSLNLISYVKDDNEKRKEPV